MQLEEMQAAWSQMSKELDQQKQLTNELIMKIAKKEYKSKINKVLRAEMVGAMICFATIVYVLSNYAKFESWQSQVCAIILVITLFVMSVGSIVTLKRMKALNIQKDHVAATIKKYAAYKKFTLQFQKASLIVGIFVLFAATAVFSVLFSKKDLFLEVQPSTMIVPMIFGLIVFGAIAYAGNKFYGKALREAQHIIDDLEQ